MDWLQGFAGDPVKGLLVLLAAASWVYLLVCVRALRAGIMDLLVELRASRDNVSEKTTLEQRAEILRRTGWVVSYLEEIDRKLAQPPQRDLTVASITAEHLVVKPNLGPTSSPSAPSDGTARVGR